MPSPRRMSRHDRRESFLDVAAALVDDAGIGALSFESLADAAGVAKTLPYAYFDSKDEILLTLFDRVIGSIDGQVEAVLTSGEDFEHLVRKSLDVWFAAARGHGRLVGALLDGRSFPGLAEAVERRDRASHKLWHDLVADRFGLTDSDAHLVAAMLNSTATATIELWIARKGSRTALVDSFVTVASAAVAALEARPAPPP
jgi:AcrR family transcriptional regulator